MPGRLKNNAIGNGNSFVLASTSAQLLVLVLIQLRQLGIQLRQLLLINL